MLFPQGGNLGENFDENGNFVSDVVQGSRPGFEKFGIDNRTYFSVLVRGTSKRTRGSKNEFDDVSHSRYES